MVAFPRIALLLVFFFTNIIEKAYANILIPVIGFFFLPLTTLLYAYIVTTGHVVAGIYLLMMIVAVLIDLGLLGGSWRGRRR